MTEASLFEILDLAIGICLLFGACRQGIWCLSIINPMRTGAYVI
jgi:hypothetical protein